jgi:hypothetical protein
MYGQLMLLLSMSSGGVNAGGDKCEVQCGIDYFGRPQYWMSAEEDKDVCDTFALVFDKKFEELGCTANTNIFRNNGFECIANEGCGRRPTDTGAIAKISSRYYEAKEIKAVENVEAADAETTAADVDGQFQGVGDCFVECGIDFAGRTQWWLSRSKGTTYCDVVDAFLDDDWSDLACTDDVAVYQTIGYHCVTIDDDEECDI